MSSEPEHVLLVPFPELAGVVEPWLEHSAGARPSHGVPPHVTLLFPCPNEAARIGEVLAEVEAFEVEFRELRRFPQGVVYLAPEPADPLLELTRRLAVRFPGWLPFRGEFAEVVPHLTVAWGERLDEAEEAVARELPLHGRARGAVLLARGESERWERLASFPFRED
jgi:2'-5' RNA ligase